MILHYCTDETPRRKKAPLRLRSAISKSCAFLPKFSPLCFLCFLLFKFFGCGWPRCGFAALRLKKGRSEVRGMMVRGLIRKTPSAIPLTSRFFRKIGGHGILPQRNAKSTEIGTYGVSSLRSLRSLAASSIWLRLRRSGESVVQFFCLPRAARCSPVQRRFDFSRRGGQKYGGRNIIHPAAPRAERSGPISFF